LTALLVLRDKVIKPLLAASRETHSTRGAQNPTEIDRQHATIRMGMLGLLQELGVVA
jgi:hypothetical protein